MEKDYFKDRPWQVQSRAEIKPGMDVFICEKEDQQSATKISDLTRVQITENLTFSPEHTMGQKIRGAKVDPYSMEPMGEAIGRCVYIVHDLHKILTKKGYKYLEISNGRYVIKTRKGIGDRKRLFTRVSIGPLSAEFCFLPNFYFTKEKEPAIVKWARDSIIILSNGKFYTTKLYNGNPTRFAFIHPKLFFEGKPVRETFNFMKHLGEGHKKTVAPLLVNKPISFYDAEYRASIDKLWFEEVEDDKFE